MTNFIEIENYKSIKHLKLETARVNVFIGEPNSGKSNIMEALAFLSQGVLDKPIFKDIFRFNTIGELFYDSDTSEVLQVKTQTLSFQLYLGKNEKGALENQFNGLFLEHDKKLGQYYFGFNGDNHGDGAFQTVYRYYQFLSLDQKRITYLPHLNPPYGDNIANLLINNPKLRKLVSDIFKRNDLRLQLNANDHSLWVAKEVDEIIYSYPYKAVSETLRRLIFYKLAIETNKGCSLIFDEPEANTFPIYTKEIGEMIGMDTENQFFVTTHNPYLLRSIIAKTPTVDLKVFVTRLENYKTTCKELTKEQLSEVLDLDMDFFFNLPE